MIYNVCIALDCVATLFRQPPGLACARWQLKIRLFGYLII